jgi:hypothetical protein
MCNVFTYHMRHVFMLMYADVCSILDKYADVC